MLKKISSNQVLPGKTIRVPAHKSETDVSTPPSEYTAKPGDPNLLASRLRILPTKTPTVKHFLPVSGFCQFRL
jgi:hypothetical protein